MKFKHWRRLPSRACPPLNSQSNTACCALAGRGRCHRGWTGSSDVPASRMARRGKPWSDWWRANAAADAEESLSSHLRHLSAALSEAEPYHIGADAMRLAWTQGRTAAPSREQRETSRNRRQSRSAEQLSNLAEAQAQRDHRALRRVSAIHSATYSRPPKISGSLTRQESWPRRARSAGREYAHRRDAYYQHLLAAWNSMGFHPCIT